jgi:phospholipase/lecithinase/hemolysin/uncharacterized protein YhjY with autotransporter beta-barrel domain
MRFSEQRGETTGAVGDFGCGKANATKYLLIAWRQIHCLGDEMLLCVGAPTLMKEQNNDEIGEETMLFMPARQSFSPLRAGLGRWGGALAISALALLSAETSQAQQFSNIQAFGDSYADTGNLFKITGTSSPVYPTGRFSGGTNYIDSLSSTLGLPVSNYAIGGALTGTTNTVAPGVPGFTQEWQGFLASGATIAPTSLVTLNIGGNDARQYYQAGGSLAGVPAAAAQSVTQAATGVGALAKDGMKTLVFSAGNVSMLPEAAAYPNASVGSAYSLAYNTGMQSYLAGLAASGVRVEYLDLSLMETQIIANPAAYGLKYTTACPATCVGNAALQSQYLFYVDGIHLTSAGFAIMSNYIVNRLQAPDVLVGVDAPSNAAVGGFVGDMFGRLDLFNPQSGAPDYLAAASANFTASAAADYTAEASALPTRKGLPAAPSPFSVYIQATGGLGSQSGDANVNGYRWDSVGGFAGVEYRLGPNAMIGAAFNYNDNQTRVNGGATSRMQNVQVGLYGALTGPHWFGEAVGSLGGASAQNSRPGVVSALTSSPQGDTFAIAARGGYLFDIGPASRLGPIAGLTYVRSAFGAYTESGDPALVLNVGAQTIQATIGSIGAQWRQAFALPGARVNAFVNLTLEDNFNGTGQVLQYAATSAPTIVNNYTAPGSARRVYGRIAFGADMGITANVALTAGLTQTLGQPGGDTLAVNGGVKIAF